MIATTEQADDPIGPTCGAVNPALPVDRMPNLLPAVCSLLLAGMVAHWPALKLWKGESGLQRLVQLAGAAQVEAMVSPAADGRAVGDMQHLVLLGCSLADFLDGSLERKLLEHRPQGSEGELRLYLAQSPLCAAAGAAPSSGGGGGGGGSSGSNSTTMQPAALHPLMEDLGMPRLLQGTQLSQINFWASLR